MKWSNVFLPLFLVVGIWFTLGEGPRETEVAMVIPPEIEDQPMGGQGIVIVLDPGHGGSNLGAPGLEDGIWEKTFTLELARMLEERLLDAGYQVRLTRRHDKYLTLRQRVQFANQASADLLLSIHANASRDHSQQGYETFLLTPRALDVDARALRVGDGPLRHGIDSKTAEILNDVERGISFQRAATIAKTIQDEMENVRGKEGNRGVKQKSLDVLFGANMPALLVEVGFIDHKNEGQDLQEEKIREQITNALVAAIKSSFPQNELAMKK